VKISLAVSEGGSELVAGRLVGCRHSVASPMVQLHGQSHHLQTPTVEAKVGIGRSDFGRAGPSPSAGEPKDR